MLAQADQTQQAEPVAPNTVFVGNLANDFLEDKVQELFSPIAPVVTVRLVRRFKRSKGFGFVTFNTAEDAEKALALHKSDVNGRTIKVEAAKPLVRRDPPKEPRKPREKRVDEPSEEVNEDKEAAPKKNRQPKRKNKKPAEKEADAEASTGEEKPAVAEKAPETKKAPRRRRRHTPINQPTATERARKYDLAPTTLFISNLPLDFGIPEIKEIFEGNPDVTVTLPSNTITRKDGTTYERVKKGRALVTFGSEAALDDALEEYDGVVVNGNLLIIKQAYASAIKQ